MTICSTTRSQPGCRGTQGCREEVSGVPPNIEFTTFFSSFTTKGAPNCHFIQARVPQIFFQSYRVLWAKKGWKTLPYEMWKKRKNWSMEIGMGMRKSRPIIHSLIFHPPDLFCSLKVFEMNWTQDSWSWRPVYSGNAMVIGLRRIFSWKAI